MNYRKPPIISLNGELFPGESANLYVDTGADISVIKKSALLNANGKVDKTQILAIKGVTSGKCQTLGKVNLTLSGLPCEMHIVPDSFPIPVQGLLGWDFIHKHGGRVNAATSTLKFDNTSFPFKEDEKFIIPPKSSRVIRVRVTNDVQIGYAPAQHIADGLLFGEFVNYNHNGITYAECLNCSDEEIEISIPSTELIEAYEIPEEYLSHVGEDDENAQILFTNTTITAENPN